MNDNYQFKDKKILVTGASGFIGAHLCRRLLDYGAEVYGISRKSQTDTTICSRWLKGDLSNSEEVRMMLNEVKPSIIFHLASHVVGARDLEFVKTTFRDNLISTINLLTEASSLACDRIILIGSLEEPEKTSDFITPSSPYAAAKFASSAYGRLFYTLYDMPVSIARLFMVYGPGQNDLKKLIPYTILSLMSDEIPKFTSGHRKVDWIFIDDVVDGLLSMAHCSNIPGKTIDIGSGTYTTIHDVVLHIISIMKSEIKPLFGSIPDRAMEQVTLADIASSELKIGWRPSISLEKGLEKTVAWYRKNYQRRKSI